VYAGKEHTLKGITLCLPIIFVFSNREKIERRRKFYADGKKNMENGQDNKLNVKMRWCDSMQSA
jgi:hypothetical protein